MTQGEPLNQLLYALVGEIQKENTDNDADYIAQNRIPGQKIHIQKIPKTAPYHDNSNGFQQDREKFWRQTE